MLIKKLFPIASAIVAIALSATANARLIEGDIGFSSNVTGGSSFVGIDENFFATTLDQAVGVDFTSIAASDANYGGGDIGTGSAIVDTATGDFASTVGSSATVADFIFAPFTPIVPLWLVDDFAFSLMETRELIQGTNFLVLTGVGLVVADGFDETTGDWALTLNGINGETGQSGGFTWSATSSSPLLPGAAVPVGGMFWLFAASTLGVLGLTRKS